MAQTDIAHGSRNWHFYGRRSRLDLKFPSDQEIHRRAASHGRITGPASLVDHVPIAE
jgi:hypothetical protein